MNRTELNKIIKAIKNMKNENHIFFIEGKVFSCRWNGKSFDWKINGRTYENCTKDEVINWIGNGEFITNYCYDYVTE